jgi:hypothetical protein
VKRKRNWLVLMSTFVNAGVQLVRTRLKDTYLYTLNHTLVNQFCGDREDLEPYWPKGPYLVAQVREVC